MPRFAIATAGLAILIVYGSLYPFHLHNSPPSDPVGALLATWNSPTGRGDLLANVALYFPLGLLFFAVLDKLGKLTRFGLAIGAGLALSTGVEFAQMYAEGRASALADVYANTAGTLLGAIGGLVLFSKGSPPPITVRRPFVVLLIVSWLGYRLVPFAPTIDLHKYWDALKPLVLSPVLPLGDLYRHTVVVLVVAVALDALFGEIGGRLVAPALVFGALMARVLILGTVLSPAEVVGGVAGIVAWNAGVRRWRHGTRLVAALLAGVVLLQALEPFQFAFPARPFGWVPFRGLIQGSVEVNLRSVFEKMFTYGALVWLTIRAGVSFPAATAINATLVLGLRLVQTLIPGRSAEITDVVLLLIMAAALKLLGEDPTASGYSDYRSA